MLGEVFTQPTSRCGNGWCVGLCSSLARQQSGKRRFQRIPGRHDDWNSPDWILIRSRTVSRESRATALREGCDALAAELAEIRTQRETQLADLDSGRSAYDARLAELTPAVLVGTFGDRTALPAVRVEVRDLRLSHRARIVGYTAPRPPVTPSRSPCSPSSTRSSSRS